MMASMIPFMGEFERDKASVRVREVLQRKAALGLNTGGKVYGYDKVAVYTTAANGEPTRSHVDYRINDAEAEVIRAIFRLYAAGHGTRNIAYILNGDPRYGALSAEYFGGRAPPPRNGRNGWAASCIAPMLHRERYVGRATWGRHRKFYRGGTAKRQRQDTVITAQRPDLRIVSDELWDEVHKRLAAMRQGYICSCNGQLYGRPDKGLASRYLLSGSMRCAECGGSLVAFTSGHPRARRNRYVCSLHHNRGYTVYSNDFRPDLEALEGPILGAIESTLTPEAHSARHRAGGYPFP